MTSLLKILREERLSKFKTKCLPEKNVKRLGPQHTDEVRELVVRNSMHFTLFGNMDIEELLSKCYISLGIENDEGALVGVICFQDYPNIPSIPSWGWTQWLHNLYGLEDVVPRNSLWIHLIAWSYEYNFLFLTPILQHLFKCIYYVENILWALPSGVNNIDFLENKATRILPKKYTARHRTQSVYLLYRQHFTTKYKIRRAVEEDNDNLVELIDIYSKRFKELYGEFYIAELLTVHQNCGRQIIVAEYQGRAVAVVCVNENVNDQMLNEEFELAPYNGLRKIVEEDHIHNNNYDSNLMFYQSELHNNVQQLPDSPPPGSLNTYDELGEIFLEVGKSSAAESDEDFLIVVTTSSVFSFSEMTNNATDEHSSGPHREAFTEILQSSRRRHPSWTETHQIRCRLRIPVYRGELNAFTMEIVAACPEHLHCLPELLEAVYECFPNRDYCVLSTPTDVPPTLLFDQFFVQVPLRPPSSFSEVLYIMTKSSIRSNINVELAVTEHEIQIQEFLTLIRDSHVLKQAYQEHVNSGFRTFSVYLMFSDDQIVGLAMLSPEQSVNTIEKFYETSDWVFPKLRKKDNYGQFKFCVLAPQYQNHATYFLKEIHRLSDFSVLLYKIQTADYERNSKSGPCNNILQTLIPITPKRQNSCYEDCTRDATYSQAPIQALFLSAISHCSLPRIIFTEKILIIGFSLTAIAFIETLIWPKFNSYLATFSNITLVSQNSLHGKMLTNRDYTMRKSLNDFRLMDCLYLKSYINLVNGTMTAIDRKEKYITISGNYYLPYDYMFLMCGEQFNRPERIPSAGPLPENVFTINSHKDISRSLALLNRLVDNSSNSNYSILVYGHYLQAYSMLSFLLENGFKGTKLILIEPFPHNPVLTKRKDCHNISMFNNEAIDRVVMEHIQDEGITIYQSYYLTEWTLDASNKLVSSVTFESYYKMLKLECIGIFLFERKTIRPSTYNAIDNAGLVFDGRLVIDTECRTNDKYIYGAGTLTKYSRKYVANNQIHKYYNREEVGRRLGEQIKEILTPEYFFKCIKIKKKEKVMAQMNTFLVPVYNEPIVRYTKLPGKLYYFNVCKPGLRIPLSLAETRKNYGTVLITGDCSSLDRQGYFRLHLNQFNKVETITCLSRFPPDLNNLSLLYGKHEQLLDNLLVRYKMSMIKDFYQYFKEPWIFGIYNDQFPALEDELNSYTANLTHQDITLPTTLRAEFESNNWNRLSKETMDKVGVNYVHEDFTKEVTKKVVSFLEQQKLHLPMYAIPSVIEELLYNYEKSPLFR